ncbi:MAG TPA: arginase family protein [Mycobacteriales bacterium]|jgi:arginase
MAEWEAIGAPSSAGAHHAGQERAPAALRRAGLLDRLRDGGMSIVDGGDLPVTPFVADPAHPRERNLDGVVAAAIGLADRVADVVRDGRRPLVLGGDCTLTLGVMAGFGRIRDDTGLVYVDGDADVGTPEHTESGIFDSMGVAHLLGAGAPRLAGLNRPGALVEPARLCLVGCDPREVDASGHAFLEQRGVGYFAGPDLAGAPEKVAEEAIARVAGASGPVVVHLDVDVVDSGDLPLGNFPHYDSGVPLDAVLAALAVLVRHESCAGLVLTEVNPTHDADGTILERYVSGLVSALTGP